MAGSRNPEKLKGELQLDKVECVKADMSAP